MESTLRNIRKIRHNVVFSRARVKVRPAEEMPMGFYSGAKDRRVFNLEYVSVWAIALPEE
jgi:hypothetical protein